MSNKKTNRNRKGAESGDIIEIVPSPFEPKHIIGKRYVVIGQLDTGFDVEIINENGEYDIVNEEDYKVVGNTAALREAFWDNVRENQKNQPKTESPDLFSVIAEGLENEIALNKKRKKRSRRNNH